MKRKLIALTGRIGSGKSAVARILRDFGYNTVDCDELAKQVATSPEVVARVKQLLGDKCVQNGQLNRAVIREIVFNDDKLLKEYQQIFFDGVKALLSEKLALLQSNISTPQACKAVFVEIPVLDAFPFAWDEIWRVESSEQSIISRVMARDNVSADSVRSTLNSQRTYDCTCVIKNNGDMEQLRQTVHTILCQNRLT